MNLNDLKRMVAMGEGFHLEFKRKVPKPERIAKEVVALANSKGGKVFLGVDDDGTVRGVRDVHEQLYLLEEALKVHCDPPVDFRIEAVPVSHRREVLVVDVPDSARKPHYLVDGQKNDQRTAYVRVKDQSIEASRELVKLMRWERNPSDTRFEFGPSERLLMRYLDQYERITVGQFARVANLTRKRASWKLLLLARAGILNLHPDAKGDYFTLAQQVTTS